VLTWLFGVMPAIYFISTGNVPSYSWSNMTFSDRLLHEYRDVVGLFIMSLMGAAFTVGAYIAYMTAPARRFAPSPPRETSVTATYLMVGLWLVSVMYFFSLSGWNLRLFLLPIRDHIPREEQSGYLLVVFIMMPLAIVAKSYWAKGRVNLWMLLWVGLSVMAAFSRSQRRDFVTMALFVVGLLLVVGELIAARRARPTPKLRKPTGKPGSKAFMGLAMLAGAAALVPILWYSRVYFTSVSQGENIDPTQIRSFSDLLLGSPATGYPTLVLIRDYVYHHGPDIFYTPIYLIATVIPRFIWPGKPQQIDGILEEHYRLSENPSAFWFGELYYAFGPAAVVAALALGFALFKISHSACTSNSILIRTLGVVIFMQTVTFYKNGISQFAINSLMFTAFILFAWFFPVTRRLPRRGPVSRRTSGVGVAAELAGARVAGPGYRRGWAAPRLRRL